MAVADNDARCEFILSSASLGCYEYRKSRNEFVGQQLQIQREAGNPEDRYAVAVLTPDANCTVGHMPSELSQLLSYFIAHGGEVMCEVKQNSRTLLSSTPNFLAASLFVALSACWTTS